MIDESIFTYKPDLTTYPQFARVVNVYSGGITLIIDGEAQATQKRYKRNGNAGTISNGSRVKISRVSGTYVIDYVVQ